MEIAGLFGTCTGECSYEELEAAVKPWLEGKTKIEGDMPLMLQLEDMISKLST